MRLLAILSLALMTACAETPLRTLAALNRVDPLSADPAGFELALTLPEGVVVTGVDMRMSLHSRRSDTGAEIVEEVVMQRRSDGATWLFRIAPEDLARVRAFQATARAWEAEAGDANTGSISVFGTGCVDIDSVPADATVSAGLRVAPGGPVLPLLRDVALLDFFAPETLAAQAATCG